MRRDNAEALKVVEGVTQQWVDAVSQQDGAAIGQLFTADAQLFVEGTELKGREAVQKFFQEGFDAGWAESSASVTEAELSGDTAYGMGTAVSKDAQGKIHSESNWLEVYKQEGGEWKIYRFMATSASMLKGTTSGSAMSSGDTES